MLSTRAHNLLCVALVAGGLGLALVVALAGLRAFHPAELIALAGLFLTLAAGLVRVAIDLNPARDDRAPTAEQENTDHGL